MNYLQDHNNIYQFCYKNKYLRSYKNIITRQQTMTETSKFQDTKTMLNLQSKRTLPRDVIKWMQGLDLSYSVKDYRKDLNNGFIFGEIVSRYQPGKIPMHAFQNSQNQARKDNNWSLLQLFFRKHQLRKIKIEDAQYAQIKNNQDQKSEQLYEFVCRLYSVCTKRTLPESGPSLDLPPTQSKNPNLTASYLLKQQGLEKLETSQISNVSNQDNQRMPEDRVPTRKIGPNIDSPARVDVKAIGIKQQANRKVTSKKKSWDMKTQSMYEETNQFVEKYVFDFLNQILGDCLPPEESGSNQLRLIFANSQQRATQVLKRNLPLDKNLILAFFKQVKQSINPILTAMLKELNEIWKFFTYFLRMLNFFDEGSQQFSSLIDLITVYVSSANLNEKKKINKVFLQSLITVLISEVKICTIWTKKDKIMNLIYNFTGRDIQDKKVALFNLKEKLGSNSTLYVSWLTVLIRQEKFQDGNEKLVQDFIYYAHQNLNSANQILRLSSLKIMSTVCVNGWSYLVQKYFCDERNIKKFRAITQFESIYFVSLIYFCLLKNIVESHEYQTLIKGKNQGNTNAIKVYNPDHERQTQQIKQRLQILSLTISKLYFNSNSQTIRQIIAKESTNFMQESTPLLLVVINHLCSSQSGDNQNNWDEFFSTDKRYYTLKTSQVLVFPSNIQQLKQCSNQILIQTIKFHTLISQNKDNINLPVNAETDIKIQDQLPLLRFCLDNLNIKKLNMELWNNIADTYLETLTELLASCHRNEATANLAWKIISRLYQIYFNYDMKMEDINLLLVSAIKQCEKQKQSQKCKEILQKITKFFEEQYNKTGNEQIKNTARQINEITVNKNIPILFAFANK